MSDKDGAIGPHSRPGVEAHKRTKSSLALSLLHRDKSNVTSRDDMPSRLSEDNQSMASDVDEFGPGSMSGSSIRPSRSLRNRLHLPKGSKAKIDYNDPNILPVPAAAAATPSGSQPAVTPGLPSNPDQPMSIEASVRIFRVVEALRRGDTSVISRSLVESSGQTGELGSPGSRGPLEGTTVLHLAIQCADQTTLEAALNTISSTPEIRIDLNSKDRDGNTPLHLASQLGRAPAVRMLLDHKNINDSAINYQGKTPLDLARSPEVFQMLQLSRSLYLDRTAKEIQSLVENADYEKFERLVSSDRAQALIDLNSTELVADKETNLTTGTLLHEAAKKKDHKLIQILLIHGADPFKRDRRGRLPQDITKDERTRAILKRSPAAAAAQRVYQEKAIQGATPAQAALSNAGIAADAGGSGKEGREMKGYLKKWTNYTSGYKLRWFVLEDGVLSYYKNQDDAGSACRGAINCRIARLSLDPKDKQSFEIQGKSSVKYSLRANHVVEAKRWYWALNNAIQWAKDEAKEDAKRKAQDGENFRRAKTEHEEKGHLRTTSQLAPDSALGTSQGSTRSRPGADSAPDDGSIASADPGLSRFSTNAGPMPEDDLDELGHEDDASEHDGTETASKDALNITAQSAKLQLELLANGFIALQSESMRRPDMLLTDPTITDALMSYESAVKSLKGLIGDLVKISRDRDAYWQYRLEREAEVRKMWEDSMAKLAREHEALEGKVAESEDKRKRTKRALRDHLEGVSDSRPQSPAASRNVSIAFAKGAPGLAVGERFDTVPQFRRKVSNRAMELSRRKSVVAEATGISDDSESDNDDEEFFDAVATGEVEVEQMPEPSSRPSSPLPAPSQGAQISIVAPALVAPATQARLSVVEAKQQSIRGSFAGYAEPPRSKMALDADDRPKISLWAILKSMIGKDMTKMTLPVSFNEPTSLLQRVAEDMEYTDLLDTAVERADSSERLVYVAAFAASSYSSTIERVAKPFNPLLGETYELCRSHEGRTKEGGGEKGGVLGKGGYGKGGFRFVVEQVSHHPPVGAAWAESERWEYFGESAVKSKFYGRSFDINPLGTWFLRLYPTSTPDGTSELYTFRKVTSSVVGIMTGNPTVDNYGPMEIKNHNTGETCLLDFKARGWSAKGAYEVKGKVVDRAGKPLWSLGGKWNERIFARKTMDGVSPDAPILNGTGGDNDREKAFVIWTNHYRPPAGRIPFNLTPFAVTLNALTPGLKECLPPTDTRLRPDQRAMEDGRYEFAATEKERLENEQRDRRRARDEKGEEFVSRWFRKEREELTGEMFWRRVEGSDGYWAKRGLKHESRWEGCEPIF